MEIRPTAIPEVVQLVPPRFGDERGWFSEVFKLTALEAAGLPTDFVQDNESFSAERHTIRGIHFQVGANAQTKLVRVLSGSILDVAVDLRRSSPTFGAHVAVTLRADVGNQLLIPIGFGHALCTLEPNCHVAYKVTAHYDPGNERSVQWNDSALHISWPTFDSPPTLSVKDAAAPPLAEVTELFD